MSDLLSLLQRQRVLCLSVVGVCLVLLLLFGRFIRVSYVGEAKVMSVAGSASTNSLVSNEDMSDIALSAVVLGRVRQHLHLDKTISDLQAQVSAKTSTKSNVMPISYHDHDPSLAIAVPNAVADETAKYCGEMAAQQYRRIIAYLKSEMSSEEGQVRVLDARMQNAVQNDSTVGSPGALDTIIARLNDLETQRASAYAVMVSDQASAAAQTAQVSEVDGIVQQQLLAADPHVTQLRSALGNDASKLDQTQAAYTNDYPALPALRDQVRREAEALRTAESNALKQPRTVSSVYSSAILDRRRADAAVAGDRAKVAALDTQISEQQEHLRELPGTGVRVNLLRVQRDAAQAAYNAFSTRLSQTQADAEEAASLRSLIVMDKVVFAKPRVPQVALDLLVAFAIAFVCVLAAYLWDLVDPRKRVAEEAQRVYGGSFIGSIGV